MEKVITRRSHASDIQSAVYPNRDHDALKYLNGLKEHLSAATMLYSETVCQRALRTRRRTGTLTQTNGPKLRARSLLPKSPKGSKQPSPGQSETPPWVPES